MTPDPRFSPFAGKLVRLHKQRAEARIKQAAFLHRRAAEDLADRLEAIPREFARVLILGGGGLMSEVLGQRPLLKERIGLVIEADLVRGDAMLDPEHLPFADGRFDLVLSPLALHWVNDLPGAFIQIRRCLKPDGLMLATLIGGQSLSQLRLALLEAEAEISGGASTRVSPFVELQDLAGLLQRAGFALPAADRDAVRVRYDHPLKLLADLRAMGETSALSERAKPLSRAVLARFCEIYAQRFSDPDERVFASFDLLCATGWAPHESQQKPLKPGSAKARLADALGVPEQKPN
jgi:SAM-dependent methyltransferase